MNHRYSLRERLRETVAGPLLLGAIQIPSPDLIEMAGFAGFDLVLVDAEHGAISARDVQDLIRAADAVQLPALVRVPRVSTEWVGRVLDAGAAGILAPHVDTAQEALELVQEGRYPPVGRRGTGFYSRTHRFTLDGGADAIRSANNGVSLGVMLESVSAVENAEAILGVEGIDFAMVGPVDMSTDRGSYRQDDDPWVRQAVRDLATHGASRGTAMFVRTTTPEHASEYWGYGYRVLAVGLPYLAVKGCVEWVEQTRTAAKGTNDAQAVPMTSSGEASTRSATS